MSLESFGKKWSRRWILKSRPKWIFYCLISFCRRRAFNDCSCRLVCGHRAHSATMCPSVLPIHCVHAPDDVNTIINVLLLFYIVPNLSRATFYLHCLSSFLLFLKPNLNTRRGSRGRGGTSAASLSATPLHARTHTHTPSSSQAKL